MSSKAPINDSLIHPALLDPRQWADVDIYASMLNVGREELPGEFRCAPDRLFRIHHIKLDLSFDLNEQSVSGTATITLSPYSPDCRKITLDAAEMSIRKVRRIFMQPEPDNSPLQPLGKSPQDLSYETHLEKLHIDLPTAAQRDEEVMIEITFFCRPRKGLFFVKPDGEYAAKPHQIWSQGQTEDAHWWFPCADTPHQKMTTELIATVDEKYFALSNGALLKTSENSDTRTKTYHWRQDQPHPAYLVTVVVGEYQAIQERVNGLPIEYYVYADRVEAGKKLFEKTPQMIEFFAGKFGYPYPFAKYSQILVDDFLFGAMENTSATTMTDRCLLDARAELDLNYEDIVAHELAHHWWGDLVTCKHWTEIWLNESFATYSEFLWREKTRGNDEARWSMFQDFLTYLNEDISSHRRPIFYDQYRYSEELMDRHAYEKGSCVLAMLRHILGDEDFFRSMARYAGKFAFGVAETNDFKVAIEEVTGKNLQWFFDQWIYSAGYPEIEVEYEWQAAQKMLRLKVKQVQKADEDDEAVEAFRFPAEIEIVHGEAGEVIESFARQSLHVWVEKCEQEFYFPCDTKPKMVVFDKWHRTFKLMRFPKSASELLFQLRHDEDFLGRARAARELANLKVDEAVTPALIDVLSREEFYPVKMAAAISLGEIGTSEAQKALLETCELSRDANVRRACVWALGKGKSDEKIIQFLNNLLTNEQSYFVLVAALRALGNLSSEERTNYEIISSGLKIHSWQEVVRSSVFHAFKFKQENRAIDLGMKHSQYGEHLAVRVAAVAYLGVIGKELRKTQADDSVVQYLMKLLKDQAIRVRVSSARALGKIGNPVALPSLREAQQYECLDQLKAALEDSISNIEAGK